MLGVFKVCYRKQIEERNWTSVEGLVAVAVIGTDLFSNLVSFKQLVIVLLRPKIFGQVRKVDTKLR